MLTNSSPLRTLLPLAAVAVGLAAGIVGPAAAESGRLSEAWHDAIGDQEPILTDKEFAVLNNLAFQAAVPKVCEGFDLDVPKFSQGIADATQPSNPSVTEDEHKHWETAVLIRFGVSYGLFLAEGNNKPDAFCASAKELKDDSNTPNYWR